MREKKKTQKSSDLFAALKTSRGVMSTEEILAKKEQQKQEDRQIAKEKREEENAIVNTVNEKADKEPVAETRPDSGVADETVTIPKVQEVPEVQKNMDGKETNVKPAGKDNPAVKKKAGRPKGSNFKDGVFANTIRLSNHFMDKVFPKVTHAMKLSDLLRNYCYLGFMVEQYMEQSQDAEHVAELKAFLDEKIKQL